MGKVGKIEPIKQNQTQWAKFFPPFPVGKAKPYGENHSHLPEEIDWNLQ